VSAGGGGEGLGDLGVNAILAPIQVCISLIISSCGYTLLHIIIINVIIIIAYYQ
jgi:hypothetical protein